VGFTQELFDDSSSSSSVDPAAQAAMISAMAEAYPYIAEVATVVAHDPTSSSRQSRSYRRYRRSANGDCSLVAERRLT